MADLMKMAINILYPAVCPLCTEVVSGTHGQSRPCPRCKAKLKYVGEARCMKCGKPQNQIGKTRENSSAVKYYEADGELCFDCQKTRHIYDQGAAVFEYTDGIKQSIYRYKYNGCRDFAVWYGDEMYEHLKVSLQMWQPEIIIPVPLHEKKKRKRGYNQAELIARRLGKLSGIGVDAESLVRSRETAPMKSLDDTERAENIKKAFTIASNTLKYKKVLLIDDIYTTGATVDACAKVLKESGVERVYCASLCIGRGV